MTSEDRLSQSMGGFKELLKLFFPLLLMTFSNYLFLLVEKLLLARLSIRDMEAAVNAAYACQIFQIPCIALVMMTQVYVGRWFGAKEWKTIGPGVWQLIWFSGLSQLLIFPLSMLYGQFYFQGSAIEQVVMPYYYFLTSINFLYPLGATLICFNLGQGKTRLVLLLTIASQLFKLILAYLLIFGWNDIIPSYGLMGGAVSTFVAQGVFCLSLLAVFLNREHALKFDSRNWGFKGLLFWECVHPGLLRAFNRILSLGCWAMIARLMTARGDDYLLILSIGGTLFLFLPFLAEALCQAQTTIVSQILGTKNYNLLNKAFRSGNLLVLILAVVTSVPLLIFSQETFHYLFPKAVLDAESIQKAFAGIWICFIFFTFTSVPIGYILSFKDTKFSLFMGALNWLNGYLMMYLAIENMQISANLFWLVLSIMHGSNALLYLWRMKWLQSQLTTPALQVSN